MQDYRYKKNSFAHKTKFNDLLTKADVAEVNLSFVRLMFLLTILQALIVTLAVHFSNK